jgi:twitching motility protein PilT
MSLAKLVQLARQQGASDLHLEGGLPPTLRIRGQLETLGEPLGARPLAAFARQLLGDRWAEFLERGSADLSCNLARTRCRINILKSSRGVGLALRLLPDFQPTIERLNLHPDLKKVAAVPHGLVIVSGATGSGKSSTLAALIHEINTQRACHIVTIESPIEYALRPRQSLIRQRQVGRDTPSFQQALTDALREDPDVLMVGEMRDPETMRLTLHAAETGHLVLTTLHSSNVVDALQRFVSAFSMETHATVCSQLADCLRSVVCQRLRYHQNWDLRIPECEILHATRPVQSILRQDQLFKITSAMETGAADGMWTRQRYRSWMAQKTDWVTQDFERSIDGEVDLLEVDHEPNLQDLNLQEQDLTSTADDSADSKVVDQPRRKPVKDHPSDVIELHEPTESLRDILSELEDD